MSNSSFQEVENLLLEQTKDWGNNSEHGEKLIFRLMELTGESMLNQFGQISQDLDSLMESTTAAQSKLNNAITDLYLISNDQFIENTVAEEDDPLVESNSCLSFANNPMSENDPQEAVSGGLQFLQEHFEKVQASSALDEFSYLPKSTYSNRRLPFLIGSKDFEEDDFIGLVHTNVSSESCNKKDDPPTPSVIPQPPPPPPPPPPQTLKSFIPSENISHASSSSAFSSRDDETHSSKTEDLEASSVNEGSSDLMNALCAEIRSKKALPPSKPFREAGSEQRNNQGIKGGGRLVESDSVKDEGFSNCDKTVKNADEKSIDTQDSIQSRKVPKSIFSSSSEDESFDIKSKDSSTQDAGQVVPQTFPQSAFQKELLARVNKELSVPSKKPSNISSKAANANSHSLLKPSKSLFDDSDEDDSLFNQSKKPAHSLPKYTRKSSTPKDLSQKSSNQSALKSSQEVSKLESKSSLFDDDSKDVDDLFNSKDLVIKTKSSKTLSRDENDSKTSQNSISSTSRVVKLPKNENSVSTKQIKKASLFDSDEDDDIFTTKKPVTSSKIVENPVKEAPSNQHKSSHLFGSDDEEEDLFKSLQTKAKPEFRLFEDSDSDSDLFRDLPSKSIKKSLSKIENASLKSEDKVDQPSAMHDNEILPSQMTSSLTPVILVNKLTNAEKLLDRKATSGQLIEPSNANDYNVDSKECNFPSSVSCDDKDSMDRVRPNAKKHDDSSRSVKRMSLLVQNQLSQVLSKRNVADESSEDFPTTPKNSESSLLVGFTKSRPRLSSNRRPPTRKRSKVDTINEDVSILDVVNLSINFDTQGNSGQPLQTEEPKNNFTKTRDKKQIKLFDSSSDEDELFT